MSVSLQEALRDKMKTRWKGSTEMGLLHMGVIFFID